MRSILFDFGGTLDYPQHWLVRFLAHYRAVGICLTREQLDLGFNHATRIAYRSTQMLAGYGMVELVNYLVHLQLKFLERYGPEELRESLAAVAGGGRLDKLARSITQSFVAETRQGYTSSREVLSALSGRFRMGVVSNFYGNLENILAEADLARFFSAVVDSSRIRIFKPEPEIFIAALRRLDAVSAETAMVGDSLSKDCEPARSLGITSIWLRHANANAGDAAVFGSHADFTIKALAELEHLQW
jgi:putative hydrolase of the HAD superfamily